MKSAVMPSAARSTPMPLPRGKRKQDGLRHSGWAAGMAHLSTLAQFRRHSGSEGGSRLLSPAARDHSYLQLLCASG